MKTFRTLIIMLLISLSLAGCSKKETIYQDNTGNQIQLSNLQNKWLILIYWAPWCPSCLKDIPEMNSFYQHHHDKFIMAGVNFDHSENESLADIIERLHITFPVLTRDPAAEWRLGVINAIPTTFIINPKGEVVKKIMGETTEEDLLKVINELPETPSS